MKRTGPLSTLKPHGATGFSLVEVLVAILILGIGVVGLTQGVTTALRSSKEAEWHSTAVLLAAGRMEELRADGFVIEGEDEGDFGTAFSRYRWKQSTVPTDIDGLFEVTVTVEDTSNEKPLYELKTLLFDPPAESTQAPTEQRRDERPTSDRRRRTGREE